VRNLDPEKDAEIVGNLLAGLWDGQAGICLCDENDIVRCVNPAYRNAFFPDLPDTPTEFVVALAEAIAAGRGIKLESMPLDVFVPRVRKRRRTGDERYNFSVDMTDGKWWWVNDYRLPNGYTLVVATDISGLKNEEFRLREAHAAAVKAAETDFLTGIPNRRSGMAHAEAALEEFRANRLKLTVAVVDIDHFKAINDTYGHVLGDEVLLHFTRALTARLGVQDHVCRLGGEEFLLVMPDTPAGRAAARLEQFMAELEPLKVGPGHPDIVYSFSAGLASAQLGEDLRSLLGRADLALYEAKANGRRQIRINRDPASDVA
jgi:diguanylate cyclase (GGDEF)-like protein